MQPDNQYQQLKKSNVKFIVPIIALALLSVGLGGYIVLGKSTNNPVESSKEASVNNSKDSKDSKEAAEAPDKNTMSSDQSFMESSSESAEDALANLLNDLTRINEELCVTYQIGSRKDIGINSPVSPYQRIQIHSTENLRCGGGAVYSLLFYRTSPNAKWKHFVNLTNVTYCDSYTTDDIKKAFFDFTCVDRASQSEIKVESLL